MKSNNLFYKAAAAATMAAMLAPSVAFAQTRLDVSAEARVGDSIRAEVRSRVCTAITGRLELLESKHAEARGRIQAHRNDVHARLEDVRRNRSERVEERQQRADVRRAGLYARLEARAETGEQKAAVADFLAEVEAAVTARRAAFDAANATFRAGVEQAVESRRTASEQATAEFRSAIRAAVEKARTSCNSGASGEEIRAQFQADVRAAREAFQGDKETVEKVGGDVRALAKARNEAHAKAMGEFKTALEAARAKLKAAFSVEASAKVEE